MKIAILYHDGRGFDIIDTEDFGNLEPQEIIDLEYPVNDISWSVLTDEAFIEISREEDVIVYNEDEKVIISFRN